MIVATGTTGAVGGTAARVLAAQGVAVRQLVRNRAKAPQLPRSEVRVMAALDDAPAVRAAIEPGCSVFLVSAFADHDERMRLHRGFVDAAAEAGAGHLVYLSFVGADRDAVFLHARSHGETEDYIRASGVPFSFLRTSYYYWTIANFVTDGVLTAPHGRVGWVDPGDCGRALAAVLAGRVEPGCTFTLTGPKAPTFAELAAELAACTGRRHDYRQEEDVDRIPLAGIPDWARAHRRSSHRSFQVGEAAAITGDVERLTGRAPVGLADYIAEHSELFA